jgi:hypothetical protein
MMMVPCTSSLHRQWCQCLRDCGSHHGYRNTAVDNPTGEFEGAVQISGGGGDVTWLSESPINGTIPAGMDQIVDVTFMPVVPRSSPASTMEAEDRTEPLIQR